MKITTGMIKELRERVGGKLLDAHNALKETDGDMEAAFEYLREKMIVRADDDRKIRIIDGIIGMYQHHNNQLGVLLELKCETDFVAFDERFQALAHDLAMHIALTSPKYLNREAVPQSVIAEIDGDLDTWCREHILMEQTFIKSDKTVAQVIRDAIEEMGETIRLTRFVRFEVGKKSR